MWLGNIFIVLMEISGPFLNLELYWTHKTKMNLFLIFAHSVPNVETMESDNLWTGKSLKPNSACQTETILSKMISIIVHCQ